MSAAQDIVNEQIREMGGKVQALAEVKRVLATMSTANVNRWHWEKAKEILERDQSLGKVITVDGVRYKAVGKALKKTDAVKYLMSKYPADKVRTYVSEVESYGSWADYGSVQELDADWKLYWENAD